MELKNKKVLVTGAGGFIGSFLVEELLKKGAEVFAFVKNEQNLGLLREMEDYPKIRIIMGDLGKIGDVIKAIDGKDIVFHLGALISIKESFKTPEDYFINNSFGTLNILMGAKEKKIKKIILSSTSEVYGDGKDSSINEDFQTDPKSPYALSKDIADKFAKIFYESYNTPVLIFRLFNVFGPRQRIGPLIPSVIKMSLRGERIKISDINSKRDFVYVKDVVDAFIRGAESERVEGEIFNIGTGNLISIGEILKKVSKILQGDISSSIELTENIEDKKSLICNNQKARDKLGWEPKYSFEEGLIETINYLRDKLD